MARAYFDQNPFAAAPIEPGLDIIRRTYSQRAPSPMDNLSKAIQQPFVTDVLVPGISRIRDELRISEQEDLIAEQAAAKRAAAAQAMQQAVAAEQQGLAAEIAYDVSALSPVAIPPTGRATEVIPISRLATGLLQSGRGAAIPGYDPSIPKAAEELLGPREFTEREGVKRWQGTPSKSLRAAKVLEVEILYGRGEGELANRIREALVARGLGDVVAEIDQGVSAVDATREGAARFQQTQERRATIGATQRFERALAGDLPQMAAGQAVAGQAVAGQALTPLMIRGRPGVRGSYDEGDKEQGRIDAIATRAYRKADRAGKSREESVAIGLAAAQAAQPEAVAAQEAQEAQAIRQPELIEQANRLREQATALEAEAKGIEATPVYRTFGDHAMAFLDALDRGDVAEQNALMASVGGSTDYQSYGEGAVGKAIGKDASMRARKDLLDLKRDWLKAKRREDTALKIVEARKKKTIAKTGRAIARSGMNASEFDKTFMTNEWDKELSIRQDRTIEYGGQTFDITYRSDPSIALQQLQSLSRYIRSKKQRSQVQGRFSKIGTRVSGTGESTAAAAKRVEEAAATRAASAARVAGKAAKSRTAAIDKEVFGLRGDLADIAADLLDARTERDDFGKEALDDMTNQPAQAAAAAVRLLATEQQRLMGRVRALGDEKKALSTGEATLATGRTTSGGNTVIVTETP